MDNRDKESRSILMSKIRQENTTPELLVRKFLHKNGFRYSLHVNALPGTPDIVLPKYKTVIFVHGCFWHGHGCSQGKLPKSNIEKWEKKIKKNKRRDKSNINQLLEIGWNVIVVWSCNLRSIRKMKIILPKLSTAIRNNLMANHETFLIL